MGHTHIYSPINAVKQDILNWNFASTHVFAGVLPKLLQTRQAIMNRVTHAVTPKGLQNLKSNLAISQYRHDIGNYIDDPLTFIGYPVFDSFDRTSREIGGVLATNIHWKLFFERVLSSSARGYICVLENSYNQTLVYRVDGSEATYLGGKDAHPDAKYEYLEESASINEYVQRESGPQTRKLSITAIVAESNAIVVLRLLHVFLSCDFIMWLCFLSFPLIR